VSACDEKDCQAHRLHTGNKFYSKEDLRRTDFFPTKKFERSMIKNTA